MIAPDSRVRLEIEPVGSLESYVTIPNRFETSTAFELCGVPPNQVLHERALITPLHKDYDALESPLLWPATFDVTKWVKVAAFKGDRLVGGAIGAFDTPGVDMLDGRDDLLVLWDIRVQRDSQGCGIGTQLFRAVQQWGIACGARELRVETQNVNVADCRFYRSMGCELLSAEPGAYPDLRNEVKLIWRVPLRP